MLFNSYTFIFLYLPVTLAGFYLIGGRGRPRLAVAWLVLASLFYYGWWNPAYLALIGISILFNYAMGVALGGRGRSPRILFLGVATNLGLLAYFKYANFFVANMNAAFDVSVHLEKIVLPLAISFFTFQQIAYLVDAYRGEAREYSFLHYSLFVTFFPQLIAGPIVHHKEMLPQFAQRWIYRLNYENLAVGVTIFVIGLFKKVVIADGLSKYVAPVFDASEAGMTLTFFEAWSGVLSYTFQVYFDFSGYSDMAIGLARMFGIRLPLNFHSPYKANNIIDFWRRWHMTLSRFLRDYLYIPLGGNRKGKSRRYANLVVTMLLGGLWHGAGWTFVVWGALHGGYLVVNQAWRNLRKLAGQDLSRTTWYGRGLARALTFIAIVFGWVFFRSESFAAATAMASAMFGGNGFALPASMAHALGGVAGWVPVLDVTFDGLEANDLLTMRPLRILLAFALVWFAPNTQQLMIRYSPAFETHRGQINAWRADWLQWRPTLAWLAFIVLLALQAVYGISSRAEFLYYNF